MGKHTENFENWLKDNYIKVGMLYKEPKKQGLWHRSDLFCKYLNTLN